MSLLFIDGFDHYVTADFTKKWTSSDGLPAVVSGQGRRGGSALQVNTTVEGITKTFGAKSSVVAGFAFNPTATPANTTTLLALEDGGTAQVRLRMRSDGTLELDRNGTALTGGVSVLALSAGAYQYIEVKVTIANSISAGSCVVRVNGVEWINVAAGQDTQFTVNAQVNSLRLGCNGSSALTAYFDDFYLCDTAGAVNNDFLGDVRVDAIYPDGAGNYQDFTPSTGTDHAALVDESSPNLTDYLTGSAVGNKETLALGNLSLGGPVLGVQVNNLLDKNDAGACLVRPLIRSNSVDGAGSNYAPSTSPLYNSQIFELDPDGSVAWDLAAVNALEAGVEVLTP